MEYKFKAFISIANFRKEIAREFPNVSPVLNVFTKNNILDRKILKKIEKYEGAIPVYDLNVTIIEDLAYLIEDFDLSYIAISEIIDGLENIVINTKSRKEFDFCLNRIFVTVIDKLKTKYILDN